ncbi:hypothetical protein AAKU67_002491 [Oxalobacteraceae bacterium GrIS 2.11]
MLRRSRVIRGADLLARLKIDRPSLSRATMMRMLRGLGDQIVMGGAARSSSYAARRAIRGKLESLPVYQIDQQGRGTQIGTLDPIYPGGCLFKAEPSFDWPVQPDWKDGWYAGLPYPLADLRPQGFLGRHFARSNASIFQVPDDPTRWSEDDVIAVLSIVGSDSPGNLILGEAAYRRFMQHRQQGCQPVGESEVLTAYAQGAVEAMAHGAPISSAGGENPKFTTCRTRFGQPVHVLVKFSGNDQTTAVRRWSDLLVCEHLALETISALLPCRAAQSTLLQTDRTFLEVQRFDRHGEFGRSALCSWAALEAAMFGIAGASWVAAAQRLLKAKLISETSAQHIAILWHFGKLIANSDMHEGNLSFRPSSNKGMLELAPAYDMLPMLYAPVSAVEIQQKAFIPALPVPSELQSWFIAAQAARQFWEAAATDQRISAEFQIVCATNEKLVAEALERMKPDQ